MPCVSAKYTESELRDMLLAKKVEDIGKIENLEEWAATMVQLNKMVSTKEVSASTLSAKMRKDLALTENDMVSLYHLGQHLLTKKRASHEGSKRFVSMHGFDKAREISSRLDSMIKANGGTRVHHALQKLMENIADEGRYNNLVRPSNIDGEFQPTSEGVISKDTGLKSGEIKRLSQIADAILGIISERQRKIDPNTNAVVLFEQFVYNPITDVGGTIDIMAMFSDKTHATLDFKTISPDETYGKVDWNTNEITDPDWIPNVKKQDLRDQLSNYNRTLEAFYGSKGAVMSRGIPLLVKYKEKPYQDRVEGSRITDEIVHVSGLGVDGLKEGQVGMLGHIPVQELVLLKDKVAQKKINDDIGRLSVIINNERDELSKIKYTDPEHAKLSALIENRQKALDALMLTQDFNELYLSFQKSLEEITEDKKLSSLRNIEDAVINDKPNPDYLTMAELNAKISEIEAMQAIINSSFSYINELGIKDPMGKTPTEYVKSIAMLSGFTGSILDKLKSIRTRREFSDSEVKAMDEMDAKPSWVDRMFRTLGEQTGVVFRKFSSYLDKANNLRRTKMQQFEKIQKRMMEKKKLAARKLGKSLSEIDEMFIDPNKENIWAQHNKLFYDDFDAARRNKDDKWLNDNLTLRDGALDRYKQNLDIFKAKRRNLSDADVTNWEKRNNPSNMKYTDKYWVYYDIKPEVAEKYFSDGFREIRKTPELLEYYNFWIESMGKYLDMLGFRGAERIPSNFLPHIRQDIIGMMSQGTFDVGHLREVVSSLWSIRQDDVGFGDMTDTSIIDPKTGAPKNTIPRFFTNPIKDSKGQVMKGMKMRDLDKSLYIFAEMATNYHYLKTEVEPHVEAMRDYMIEHGMQQTTDKGRKKKLLTGVWSKLRGEATDPVAMYDKWVNMHLYGIKVQDASKDQAKFIQFAKSLQSKIELTGSPLLWIGNFVQIKVNAYLEGVNGYFYNNKQRRSTEADAMGVNGIDAMKIFSGGSRLFQFYTGQQEVQKKNMAVRFADRWLNWDTTFIGMRKSEQAVSNVVGMSILRNYGIVDGKIVRISTAPKGTKSIRDGMRIVNDTLVIDGVTNEKGEVINLDVYGQIRKLGVAVGSRVKGSMNPEDMSLVYTSLLTNAMMGFKTWLPAMADARFGGLKYDPRTNSFVEGRYRVALSDMAKEDRGYLEWLGNVVAPKMAGLVFNAATFGLVKYKVNETRARRLFDKYKEDNRNDQAIQDMKFEDYLEFRQGQLKSMSAELTAMLGLIIMTLALRGDWDDDGEPDWKSNYASRTLFRALNRARRETAFFISFDDWTSLFRMPIPSMSLIIDGNKALWHTLYGVGQIVQGEEPVTPGGRSRFYYPLRLIPLNKTVLLFEPDKLSQLREI